MARCMSSNNEITNENLKTLYHYISVKNNIELKFL